MNPDEMKGLPETPDPHFHPSPVKVVIFSDGKQMPMSRAERRARKLYGKNIIKEGERG